MSVTGLLDRLQCKGVTLWRVGEKIRFRALSGVLTDADRAEISAHRQQLLQILPQHDTRYLPLNELQQAYLIGARPGLPLGGFDAVYCLELQTTSLDRVRLQQALRHMLDGHPALRTVVDSNERLRICDDLPDLTLPYHDLTTAVRSDVALLALRQQLLMKQRDYSRWPLFDIWVVRMNNEDWRLLIRIELLILDAWSGYRFIQQWLAIYAGQEHALSFPDLSPAVICQQAQQLRTQPRWLQAKAWWQEKMATFPPPPALPVLLDARQASANVSRISDQIPACRWQQIKEIIRQQGVTRSALLFSVFADVLARWSHSDTDVLLNMTLFQRAGQHIERNDVLGDFTNIMIVPCPVRQPEESTFTHAQRVQTRLWEYLEYSQYSGVQVLRQLTDKSPAHRVLAAPIVFTSLLFDIAGQSFDLTPADWQQSWAISRTPQVALDFQVYEDGGKLVLSWDYASDLFHGVKIDAVMRVYTSRLNMLSDASDTQLQQPLLLDDELLSGALRLGQFTETMLAVVDGQALREAEYKIATCWSELLGRTISAGHTVGFMESGGTSMQIVQLQMALAKIFNQQLPVAALFQHNTIAEQARLVCVQPAGTLPEPVKSVSRRDYMLQLGKHRRRA